MTDNLTLAQKKAKFASTIENDTLFESDEVVLPQPKTSLIPMQRDSILSHPPGDLGARAARGRKRHKLDPEARIAKFDQLFNFVSERLGRRPAVKTPQVRYSAWIHLFGLAKTPEQLQNVAELFPRWKDSRKDFTAHHTEMFIRKPAHLPRCSRTIHIYHNRPLRGTKHPNARSQSLRRPLEIRHVTHSSCCSPSPPLSPRQPFAPRHHHCCSPLSRV